MLEVPNIKLNLGGIIGGVLGIAIPVLIFSAIEDGPPNKWSPVFTFFGIFFVWLGATFGNRYWSWLFLSRSDEELFLRQFDGIEQKAADHDITDAID